MSGQPILLACSQSLRGRGIQALQALIDERCLWASQTDTTQQSDLHSHTRATRYQDGTHRWQSTANLKATYNANGQPQRIGEREYVWDALGRLVEIRQQDTLQARYSYSHRGERIGKTIQPKNGS